MARRTLIWHLGLADPARAVVPASLERHREALADLAVRVVADATDAAHATHELLRTHEDAGLRRRDVAGAWARIADRVWHHRGTSVVSTPGLCAADAEQLRLALDPLIGVEVHLVVTVEPIADQLYGAWTAELVRGARVSARRHQRRVVQPLAEPGTGSAQATRFWAGHDLAAVIARWGWTLHADRLHVVAGTPADHWSALLSAAGLPAGRAGALPPVVPAYVDPASAALLREVNRRAEEPLTPAVRRGLLQDWDSDDATSSPARPVDPAAFEALVRHWSTTLAGTGHDVRGDLAGVLDHGGAAAPAPGPRVRLELATQALAESLGEQAELADRVTRLEREVAALDRKRRTWKRRAKGQHELVAVS